MISQMGLPRKTHYVKEPFSNTVKDQPVYKKLNEALFAIVNEKKQNSWMSALIPNVKRPINVLPNI